MLARDDDGSSFGRGMGGTSLKFILCGGACLMEAVGVEGSTEFPRFPALEPDTLVIDLLVADPLTVLAQAVNLLSKISSFSSFAEYAGM